MILAFILDAKVAQRNHSFLMKAMLSNSPYTPRPRTRTSSKWKGRGRKPQKVVICSHIKVENQSCKITMEL